MKYRCKFLFFIFNSILHIINANQEDNKFYDIILWKNKNFEMKDFSELTLFCDTVRSYRSNNPKIIYNEFINKKIDDPKKILKNLKYKFIKTDQEFLCQRHRLCTSSIQILEKIRIIIDKTIDCLLSENKNVISLESMENFSSRCYLLLDVRYLDKNINELDFIKFIFMTNRLNYIYDFKTLLENCSDIINYEATNYIINIMKNDRALKYLPEYMYNHEFRKILKVEAEKEKEK